MIHTTRILLALALLSCDSGAGHVERILATLPAVAHAEHPMLRLRSCCRAGSGTRGPHPPMDSTSNNSWAPDSPTLWYPRATRTLVRPQPQLLHQRQWQLFRWRPMSKVSRRLSRAARNVTSAHDRGVRRVRGGTQLMATFASICSRGAAPCRDRWPLLLRLLVVNRSDRSRARRERLVRAVKRVSRRTVSCTPAPLVAG